MKTPMLVPMVMLALLVFSPRGHTGAPRFVPVQGVLTDASGAAVQGEVQVRFAVYPGQGDTALWSETQSVAVQNGLFAVYLGQANPLDLSIFKDHDDLRLGITVGQDQEMPRIPLGSTPFSGYAEFTGSDALSGLDCAAGQVVKWNGDAWACADDTDTDTDTLADMSCLNGQTPMWDGGAWVCHLATQPTLPSGAVMFFNLPDCPPGFSPLPQAAGRYLVGLPTGGVLGASVGTALDDQENRPVGRHGHNATTAPHSHGLSFYNYSNDNYSGTYVVSGPDRGNSLQATNPATVSVTVEESGLVEGTPAPYLQFTVCVKD